MTGPCTSRAMVCTASKSPGEVIGKPASMMSTPSRASCCAISSFSWRLSEMPGDCSPSRRVVSKIRTRSLPALSFMRSLSCLCPVSPLGLRLRGRHALFPPRGEEEKSEGELELHRPSRLQGEDDFADVPALGDEAVRIGAALERESLC